MAHSLKIFSLLTANLSLQQIYPCSIATRNLTLLFTHYSLLITASQSAYRKNNSAAVSGSRNRNGYTA